MSDNISLTGTPVVTYASPSSTGRLSFTPLVDQSGTATITVLVEDGGLDSDLSTPQDNAFVSQELVVHVGRSGFEVVVNVLRLYAREPATETTVFASSPGMAFELNQRTWFGVDVAGVIGNESARVEIPDPSIFLRVELIGRESDQQLNFADKDHWQMRTWASNGGSELQAAKKSDDSTQVIHLDWPRPWQNPINPSDVNNDRSTTALDALQSINELGRGAYNDPSTGLLKDPSELDSWPGIYYDRNGDNRVTALDALRVINQIARKDSGGSAEGEATTVAAPPPTNQFRLDTNALRRDSLHVIEDRSDRITDANAAKSTPRQSESTETTKDLFYESFERDSTEAVDQLLSTGDLWTQD